MKVHKELNKSKNLILHKKTTVISDIFWCPQKRSQKTNLQLLTTKRQLRPKRSSLVFPETNCIG